MNVSERCYNCGEAGQKCPSCTVVRCGECAREHDLDHRECPDAYAGTPFWLDQRPCELHQIVALVVMPGSTSLWGSPWPLTRGMPAEPHPTWRWLGSPGWWGSIPAKERAVLEPWIASLGGAHPDPGEWSLLADYGLSVPFYPRGGDVE